MKQVKQTVGALLAVLTLTLAQPADVSQVRLTFDPDLCREIMPSMQRLVRGRQAKGLPPQLVRDFTVELLRGGQTAACRAVSGNSQRLSVLDFAPVRCDAVRIRVSATHGWPAARIFEVRIYAQETADGPQK